MQFWHRHTARSPQGGDRFPACRNKCAAAPRSNISQLSTEDRMSWKIKAKCSIRTITRTETQEVVCLFPPTVFTHTHVRALPSSWEVLSLGLAFCLRRCSVTGSGSFAGRQSQAHDDCSRFPLKHLLPKNAYDVIAHQSWFLRKRHKSKPVVWTNVCKETQQGSASCATLKQQRAPLQEATSVLSVRFSLEASEFHPLWRASSVKTATNATSLLLASTCLWTVAHAPPR